MATKLKGDPTQKAIETIVANCGGRGVRKVLDGGHPAFKPNVVRSLARTSPEYQRHVVNRALAGDRNPCRLIAATLLVYDTVGFSEVTSRLHRALGSVRQEVELMNWATRNNKSPNRLSDRVITLDMIAEQTTLLRGLLANLETIPGEAGVGRLAFDSSQTIIPKVTERLYAASGLGLIAKNVRNVAKLQPEHRPTPREKSLALWLTESAAKLAVAGRDAARKAFGRVDDECRVRPRAVAVRRIITHAKPDGDAIAAAWLAERFLLPGANVELMFLKRERAFGAWRAGDCLVDVGNTNEPADLFFDHKPPAFPNRHDSCAARLVWDHLTRLGRPVGHLKSLVDVVCAGDSARERVWFREEYAESRRQGFHRMLADAAAVNSTDAAVYRVARRWLEAFHRRAATRR